MVGTADPGCREVFVFRAATGGTGEGAERAAEDTAGAGEDEGSRGREETAG